uniref:Uncharacterized protein n=1 Tax=Timema bartmani TaxID=61472 RepID=A0A7R9I3W7_9NEOP|nr:unnamed protein product [Timema bartmani]
MTSLVLTDSSQLTADGFEKLPDQIMPETCTVYLIDNRTCLSEASIRDMQSTKDGLKHYNYQCNTVSFTKNFIKKGHGALKLYLARLEEEKRIEAEWKKQEQEDLRDMALLAQIIQTFSERRVQVGFKTLPDDSPSLCQNKHSAHNDDYIVVTLDHVTISFLKQMRISWDMEQTRACTSDEPILYSTFSRDLTCFTNIQQ